MSLEAICICLTDRVIHGCPRHSPAGAGTPESVHRMLIRILENQGVIMTAIDNLNAADQALKTEVTQAISDWQSQLASAGAANDPAIQQVANDMQAVVQQLQASDPASSASGAGTGTSNTGSAPALSAASTPTSSATTTATPPAPATGAVDGNQPS